MRIQLDLDQSGKELVDHLEEITGCKTHTDFFNSAVTLFEWAVQQRISGRIIASLDESNMNYKELQMPALERAARPASATASASHAARE
jgi:hypothetical protein